MNENIKKEIKEELKAEMDEHISQLFENALFMKRAESKVIRMVEEEVRVQVRNADLHALVGEVLKNYLHDNIKELIKNIIEQNVHQLNKKLNRDYEVAKKLSYSIDAEIKHVLLKAPISYNAEKVIKNVIMEEIGKITSKKGISWKEVDEKKLLNKL